MYRKHAGFSLIEISVVMAVVALVLPAVFAIVFVIAQQQSKVYKLTEVKKQGDYVLNYMQNKLRQDVQYAYYTDKPSPENFTQLNELCPRAGNTSSFTGNSLENIAFKSKNGLDYKIYGSDNGIVFFLEEGQNEVPLSSDQVKITEITIGCVKRSLATAAVISFGFNISSKTLSRDEDVVSLNYQTKIKLRDRD